MNRLRMKKVVNVDEMSLPPVQRTFDASNRLSTAQFDYKSITVIYVSIWVGDTNVLQTQVPNIGERV